MVGKKQDVQVEDVLGLDYYHYGQQTRDQEANADGR